MATSPKSEWEKVCGVVDSEEPARALRHNATGGNPKSILTYSSSLTGAVFTSQFAVRLLGPERAVCREVLPLLQRAFRAIQEWLRGVRRGLHDAVRGGASCPFSRLNNKAIHQRPEDMAGQMILPWSSISRDL